MLASLASQVSNGARDDELVQCAIGFGEQLVDRIVAFVQWRMRSSQSSIGLTIDSLDLVGKVFSAPK